MEMKTEETDGRVETRRKIGKWLQWWGHNKEKREDDNANTEEDRKIVTAKTRKNQMKVMTANTRQIKLKER
jgi:hypothetical protein